jgi:hypothetical protein
MGIVAAGAVVVANLGPSNTQSVKTQPGSDGSSSLPVTPWWQTWTADRHNGPVDQTFLTNAKPQYDGESAPEDIKVWATGSMPDGSVWVMFTSHTTGHEIQWLQGYDSQPDFGESTQTTTQYLTWDSFAFGTQAAHDDYHKHQTWMIVVGEPGTTDIEYAADGSHFNTPLDMHDGIGVLKLEEYAPSGAKVQLSDASGVYATGTPMGAGALADNDPTPNPTATATPTATPTNGTGEATPATDPPTN